MKCEIIKDLIPLSAEGLCSDESEKEIQEHIKECDNCRLLYEKVPEKQEEIEKPDEKETFKKINRKFKKLSIKSGIIIAILIVVLTGLGWLTHNQITKGAGMISFETIFQSMEVRKIANYIADGDFESYVDSISIGDGLGLMIKYINYDDLKQKDIQLLQQTFHDAYNDTQVEEIRVYSRYDCAAQQIYYADDAYSVYNVVKIVFENGKFFDIYLKKNKDGRYIADFYHISSDADFSDEEIAFYNAVNFANYHSMSPYGLIETLLMSNKISKNSTANSMYASRFRKEYRNQVDEGDRDFHNKGYTVTNAYFSYARYDTEKDMLYYEVTIKAEDSKGSAVMTTRLYYDYMGFYPPEKDSINIFNNNCTSELEEALYNFFG